MIGILKAKREEMIERKEEAKIKKDKFLEETFRISHTICSKEVNNELITDELKKEQDDVENLFSYWCNEYHILVEAIKGATTLINHLEKLEENQKKLLTNH